MNIWILMVIVCIVLMILGSIKTLSKEGPRGEKIKRMVGVALFFLAAILICILSYKIDLLQKEESKRYCNQMPLEPICQADDPGAGEVIDCFLSADKPCQEEGRWCYESALELAEHWARSPCFTRRERERLRELVKENQLKKQEGLKNPRPGNTLNSHIQWGDETDSPEAQMARALREWAIEIDGSSCVDASEAMTSLRCALRASAKKSARQH